MKILAVLLLAASMSAHADTIMQPYSDVKVIDYKTFQVRGTGGTAHVTIEGSCHLSKTDKVLIITPYVMNYNGKVVVEGEKICKVWKVQKVK